VGGEAFFSAQRLETAGYRDALLLVLEVVEMEAEAREQRKIARLRRAAQLPPGKTLGSLDPHCDNWVDLTSRRPR
jgi:hypothetical protein